MRRLCAAAVMSLVVLLAIPAAAGGGGCAHDADTAQEGKGVTVRMPRACFTPTNLWVQPGQTVTWINDGSMDHTVHGPGFNLSADLKPGMKYSFKFENAGVFSYMCQYHPGMSGVVVVGTPKAPATTIDAPEPNSGISGDIRKVASSPVAAPATVADSSSTDAGTLGGVAALSGATLGAIGFSLGRRRRSSG